MQASRDIAYEMVADIGFWLNLGTQHSTATRNAMKVLSAFCTVGKIPQHGVQERIGNAIANERFKVLRHTYMLEGERVLLMMTSGGVQTALELSQIVGLRRNQQLLYATHEAFLKMCIALCNGGHRNNQQRVREWLPLDVIVRVLRDTDPYPQIRHIKVLYPASCNFPMFFLFVSWSVCS